MKDNHIQSILESLSGAGISISANEKKMITHGLKGRNIHENASELASLISITLGKNLVIENAINEALVKIKRRWTESYPAVFINPEAVLRNKIVKFIGGHPLCRCTREQFNEYCNKMEEDVEVGRKPSASWLSKNKHIVKTMEVAGEQYVKLTENGKRIFNHLGDNSPLNESTGGKFKYKFQVSPQVFSEWEKKQNKNYHFEEVGSSKCVYNDDEHIMTYVASLKTLYADVPKMFGVSGKLNESDDHVDMLNDEGIGEKFGEEEQSEIQNLQNGDTTIIKAKDGDTYNLQKVEDGKYSCTNENLGFKDSKFAPGKIYAWGTKYARLDTLGDNSAAMVIYDSVAKKTEIVEDIDLEAFEKLNPEECKECDLSDEELTKLDERFDLVGKEIIVRDKISWGKIKKVEDINHTSKAIMTLEDDTDVVIDKKELHILANGGSAKFGIGVKCCLADKTINEFNSLLDLYKEKQKLPDRVGGIEFHAPVTNAFDGPTNVPAAAPASESEDN